jgi:hypothetical protein
LVLRLLPLQPVSDLRPRVYRRLDELIVSIHVQLQTAILSACQDEVVEVSVGMIRPTPESLPFISRSSSVAACACVSFPVSVTV